MQSDRPTRIPIFPLEKILFPHMALPLHIFEERYQDMTTACIEQDLVFGIVQEGMPERGHVGTAARIQQVMKEYDDGRLDLLVVGEDRFRILKVYEEKSYLEADVELFGTEPRYPPEALPIEEVLRLYKLYIERLGLEEDHQAQLVELMEEVDEEQELSYIIGQTIGMDNRMQQELLEKTNPLARMRLLKAVLARHNTIHSLARDLFEHPSGFDPMQN